jgi:hypothetical protein
LILSWGGAAKAIWADNIRRMAKKGTEKKNERREKGPTE